MPQFSLGVTGLLTRQEFAIFGLMAIGGGLLGALFNCLNKRRGLEQIAR